MMLCINISDWNWTAINAIAFIVITLMLVRIACKQNKIQKNNIKLQMFDRRYKCFDLINTSILCLSKTDVLDKKLFSQTSDSEELSEIFRIKEDLQNYSRMSDCLFENPIPDKMIIVSKNFDKLVGQYISSVKSNLDRSPEELQIMSDNNLRLMLAKTEEQKRIISEEFSYCHPLLFQPYFEFQLLKEQYRENIAKSGIMEDISKYISISKIDK